MIIAAVVVVVVLSLIAYYLVIGDGGGEQELYNGVLEAAEVDLKAEVTGRVLSMPVKEGQRVEQGQVVCELDREKLDLQLRAARAELRAQQAVLAAMEEGARSQEVEQVRLLLEQARTQLSEAEKNYGRMARLRADNVVSEAELDRARTARDLARDQVGRAGQQYDLVLKGVRDEELKAQLAKVDAVGAKVDLYEIQVKDALMESPLSGRVVELFVEPGELVMTGGLVMTLADYRVMEVKVYVPEDRVGRVSLDQEAAVMVDSFPGKQLSGRVSHKSKEAEFTPKSVQTREERTTLVYEVTVTVENPGEWAVAGLPADVRFMQTGAK